MATSAENNACRPLRNLDELFNYHLLCCRCKSSPTQDVFEQLPAKPRVLLCHDFKGGYLIDKHHCSSRTELMELPTYCKSLDYNFTYWRHIDVFVYFSHYFVTVPPCSWIAQAHANGVKILGTFIVENAALIEEVLSPANINRVIKALVELCVEANFDGWLFNIEANVRVERVESLLHLVKEVCTQLHELRRGSLVLWYDSVTTSGFVRYKNGLANENKAFFDVCDGFFTNYSWSESTIQSSVAIAGDRANDVYIGIDVFGRKTPYKAGFNTPDVVKKVTSISSCSVAMFAPGWVLECNDVDQFEANQKRFWSQMPRLR